MVVRTMIADQKEQQGKVTRHIFCPFFMDKIVRSVRGFALIDHAAEFMPEQLKYNLGDADFIFAPVLFDNHWFCYAIETRSMCFYVLDSLVDSVRGGQTVIRFKTEPKTEITENYLKWKPKPKPKHWITETEMLQEKPKTISFITFLCANTTILQRKPKNRKPNKKTT